MGGDCLHARAKHLTEEVKRELLFLETGILNVKVHEENEGSWCCLFVQ